MTISLKNRLALTYALFISAALGALTLVINIFTGLIFTALVKDNIAGKSEEIVRDIGGRYNPLSRGFDAPSVEAMGMYFVHEGYILSLEDEGGNLVWDARSCDMQQCLDVINGIAGRMEDRFRLKGGLRKEQYPVSYLGKTVGTLTIETYGPFFYSETETKFLSSINRLLLAAGIMLTLVSVIISTLLSRAIARPVKKAGEAARQIAKIHSGGRNAPRPVIRIPEQYKTRELAELSRSLNELAEELEEAERRQKRLSSDIAHELRTPLSCLQGDIEAMIDGVYKPDKKHLESCHEEILRLTGLVQDLNTLTNLEGESGDFFDEKTGDPPCGMSKKLHKTEFDLAKLLRITAEQFRTAAKEKGIEITLDLKESPIIADYDRLKQVFINLLSNAVKYTDAGGITVTLAEAPGRDGQGWEVAVADTGIGIPEGDLPHIFERFYRSDKSRSRSTGGAGIGLAIAAAIVFAHGGTITAESRAGQKGGTGSIFRVRL
ncbi:MAG: HAMP domain-containing protein [Treponema sp.]|jgi:signal transduction histidine kinase|nr:HAMP domain-containing protein [Treponema sp.]